MEYVQEMDLHMNGYLVAAEGSGDFATIQAAIDAIPDQNSGMFVVRIRPGVYVEKLHIEKPWATILNEQQAGEYSLSRVLSGEDDWALFVKLNNS
ncbi:pectinesterase family protein [Paenibacillus illinoisensis]